MNYWTIFITGLFAGGLTCLAMQGGLLTAAAPTSISVFLGSRLLAYTFLGLILGSIGSVFTLSLNFRILIQILVSIFMLGTALNLLAVHPIFRYFVITPPKILGKFVRKESKIHNFFSPAILGFMTIFLPCGATQAMMAYAISTGSAFLGATVMFVFILGTTPLFVLLGFIAKKIYTINFSKISAWLLIILAVYSLDGAIALTGKPYTIEKILNSAICQISFCSQGSWSTVTSAEILFTTNGYKTYPEQIVISKGSQVTLKLKNNNASSCIQSFTIPSLNYQKIVSPGTTTEFTFTAPNTPGDIPFMCGMGMYRGNIKVI